MSYKRRHFLQLFAGSLGSVGLQYASVLAQPTTRRKALLVGINNYRDSISTPRYSRLRGAANDVFLQRELLTARFGFQSNDIEVLYDEKATRTEILTKLKGLVDWARPGDIVVFHFSGHGSKVADPGKVFSDGRVSTIVPFNEPRYKGVPDITGHTLWLLLKLFKTKNVCFVLDCCYSGGARQGTMTLRSREGDEELTLMRGSKGGELWASPEEQAYQKELMKSLKMTEAQLTTGRKQGIPNGLMLSASQATEKSIDLMLSDRSVGLFTYHLTNYLQELTKNEAISQSMKQITTNIRQFCKNNAISLPQTPQLVGDSSAQLTPVFFSSIQSKPAEGRVTRTRGNKIDLFLGGVDLRSLSTFGAGAVLSLLDKNNQELGFVEIEAREGWTAQGNLFASNKSSEIPPGTLLQERSRVIPKEINLALGLDATTLNTQEITVATSMLGGMNRIQADILQEQEVQYILGRVTPALVKRLETLEVKNIPVIDTISLFSAGLMPIAGSTGEPKETMSNAIDRLRAKLKSLLAGRIVRLMLNTESSKLDVSVQMKVKNDQRILAETFTVRGVKSANQTRSNLASPNQAIPINTRIEFLIQNNESFNLYASILQIDSKGDLAVLTPLPINPESLPIPPNQTVRVPDRNRGERYGMAISEPIGMTEVLILVTTKPLTNVLKFLKTLASETASRGDQPIALKRDPVEAITNLLGDLNERNRSIPTPLTTQVSSLDVTKIAALSMTFDVIAGSNA